MHLGIRVMFLGFRAALEAISVTKHGIRRHVEGFWAAISGSRWHAEGFCVTHLDSRVPK
jgi:hypothetical protein